MRYAPDVRVGHALDTLPVRVDDETLLAVLLGQVDDRLRAIVRLLGLEVLGDRSLVLGRCALEVGDRLERPRRLRPKQRDWAGSARTI